MRRPPPLGAGARVALVAPAGPVRGEDEVRVAEENVRSLGWVPVVGAHALTRRGYLAGSDRERLIDLNRALADESVAALWCLRGGYGSMRLLDEVDYASLRRKPKVLLGYSDITALHSAVATRCETITFHGPTARTPLSAFSRDSLVRALDGGDPCGTAERGTTLFPGKARGHLVGGNLALLSSLAGTPYEPPYEGGILVIEDVNEPLYRIDRMLTQLRLTGALRRCVGLAFGALSQVATDSADVEPTAPTLREVLRGVAESLRLPCIEGVPVGHIADQWTIPLGAQAELDADARTLRVAV